MDIPNLAQWTRYKGINLLGTGDFTHPLWLHELKSTLKPLGNGLYEYNGVNFILTAEICNIFGSAGQAKRVHNVILAPSFEAVDRINKELGYIGNLEADGRPMLSLAADEMVRIMLAASPDCMIIPGHAWTPYFGIFGANSGFDSVEQCFGKEAKNIYCLETGLSSDPKMNWRLSKLDKYSLISNSDSHSPQKIGREANIFNCEMSYKEIINALKTKDKTKFLYTAEFFPEEGKYHWDGHRVCQVRMPPGETKKNNFKCPRCGKPVTVGVMHRVEKLADRPDGFVPANSIPFKNMIPLLEIIAQARQKAVGTQTVEDEYKMMIQRFGSEFNILFDMPKEEIEENISPKIAGAILRVREGKVNIAPGYDGVYGEIKIFDEEEGLSKKEKQMELF
jgi:uncharacterized protein (TIGR00375 family)